MFCILAFDAMLPLHPDIAIHDAKIT